MPEWEILLQEWLTVWQLPAVQIQAAVIAGCLLVALVLRRLLARADERPRPASRRMVELGREGVSRLIFPLVALGLLFVARLLLAATTPVRLISLAMSLLSAMALVRLSVFALRHAFAPSGWLASFEKWLAVLVWSVVALHILGWLPQVLEALDDVSISVGKQTLSLLTLSQGLLTVGCTLVAALWLGGVVEARLMQTAELNASVRLVVSRLVKAVLVVLAVLGALPLVGIDLTMLSVLGGALGVGLGFGLQKIAANYVSGFILLLDRSIQLGNMITVGQERGVVTQITTRYTVLQKLSGAEVLVPNETLVGSVVINDTFSHPRIRVEQRIQIAYEADVDLAIALMNQAAREHPRVLASEDVNTFLETFADFGITLVLAYWIEDPALGVLGVRSDINRRILQSFRDANIEIPYPRQDLTVRTMPDMVVTARP